MKILIGISGGIAAYKIPNLVRLCIKNKHQVKVVLTPSAARFVSPMTLEVLSENKVWIDDFDSKDYLAHINLADWADVFVLAPATANTLAKLSSGIADNLLTSTALALTCRKLVFPAMNVHMYENPTTTTNLKKLSSFGWDVIDPDQGFLACGYTGKGRLPDENLILAHIERNPQGPLKGVKIIVTAGATVENIDPVRFISNRSSGKMGIELALAADHLGAEVTLVHGKVSVPLPSHIATQAVESTSDMLEVLQSLMPQAQGLIMAAAPADYRPLNPSSHKIKKDNAPLSIELTQNPDILKTLAPKKGNCRILGFALETNQARENALQKLHTKNMDWIVLNEISSDFHPMGSEKNRIRLIQSDGTESLFDGKKSELAVKLLEHTFLA